MRQVRELNAAQFNDDLKAIVADARRRQQRPAFCILDSTFCIPWHRALLSGLEGIEPGVKIGALTLVG